MFKIFVIAGSFGQDQNPYQPAKFNLTLVEEFAKQVFEDSADTSNPVDWK